MIQSSPTSDLTNHRQDATDNSILATPVLVTDRQRFYRERLWR